MPECRAAGGWEGVTFEHLLDMATGRYDSAEDQADEDTSNTSRFFLATTHAEKIRIACTRFPRKDPPGRRLVYHTTDTYMLGTALAAWWRKNGARSGFLSRLAGRAGVSTARAEPGARDVPRRTLDARAQPFTGWGLVLRRDDLVKLGGFLSLGEGKLGQEQLLDPPMVKRRAASRSRGSGLPHAGRRYSATTTASGPGTSRSTRLQGARVDPVHVRLRRNHGRNAAEQVVYYYVSDGGVFRWARAVAETSRLRSVCAARSPMAADAQGNARRFPTAPPDGLLAAALLAFLATAGFFYVNIMAALVPGLVDGLGFSQGDAGRIGSLNIYGAAFGALFAVAIVGRVRWRAFAACALIVLMALDAVSILVAKPGTLMALRFLHGTVGGALVGVAYSVFARTRSPDRVFGMLLAVQFGLGGLGVMVLPRLVPVYGHGVLFATLVAFSFVTLLMLPFLDRYPAGRVARPAASGGVRKGLLAATAAALFLFQAGNMALLVYMIPLARDFGLGTGYASTVLGVATWVGIAGCLAVVVFGTRFGRAWPLAIAATADVARLFRVPLERVAGRLPARQLRNEHHLVVRRVVRARHVRRVRPGRAHRGARRIRVEDGPCPGPVRRGLAARIADYSTLINISVVVLAVSVPVMLVPARGSTRVLWRGCREEDCEKRGV